MENSWKTFDCKLSFWIFHWSSHNGQEPSVTFLRWPPIRYSGESHKTEPAADSKVEVETGYSLNSISLFIENNITGMGCACGMHARLRYAETRRIEWSRKGMKQGKVARKYSSLFMVEWWIQVFSKLKMNFNEKNSNAESVNGCQGEMGEQDTKTIRLKMAGAIHFSSRLLLF